MRLLIAATAAALAITAAAAEPQAMMGSGPMRSSGMSMSGQP